MTHGEEVLSIGAESAENSSLPTITLTRLPRIDLDLPYPEVTVPSSKLPLKVVKVNKAKDGGEKPQWVFAHIWREHINSGETTAANLNLAEKIRKRGIWQSSRTNGDQCGHIVGRQIGGKMVEYNLFPQCAKLNMGWNGTYFLWKVIDFLAKKWVTMIPEVYLPNVEFQMRLYYNDSSMPDRPNKFKYSVGFFLTRRRREGQEEQDRYDLTMKIFNKASQAIAATSMARLAKAYEEIEKEVKEARRENTQEYRDFLSGLRTLIHYHTPIPAATSSRDSELTVHRNRSLGVVDFIPVVGSVKGIYEGCEDLSDGNVLSGGLNVALGLGGLVLDVATLGGAGMMLSAGKTVAKSVGKKVVQKTVTTAVGSAALKGLKK